MFRFLILFILIKVSLECPLCSQAARKSALRFRLPKTIKPTSYSIALEPELKSNLYNSSFNGSVSIKIISIENTINVTLHAGKLNINDKDISVKDVSGRLLPVNYVSTDEENEFYIITLKKELIKGNQYILIIGSYSGILRTDGNGLYLGRYSERGVNKIFVATQFEPSFARKAFPCFDEPEFKATFNIRITRPKDYNSISNTPLLNTIDLGNGLYTDVYTETVIMSTYLVAFVVHQFKYITESNQRIFAQPRAIIDGWCEYALKTGLKIQKTLEEYLKIRYSLPKLDQIAIPDKHFMGAMENWGLITYKEPYLLFSKNHSTSHQLQDICTVIAHEHAHQWFGNLVTLRWWKYLWLNEGFATYFEFAIASFIEPTWRLNEQFLFFIHEALLYDSTNRSTPMNYEGPDNEGAPILIAYNKAAAVLRMINHFLTEEIFKESLHMYLTERKFSTATPNDLHLVFQIAVDKADMNKLLGGYKISYILDSWTNQEGYPLVTIKRNYNTGSISLHQKRFLLKKYKNVNTKLLWPIPVNVIFSENNEFDFFNTTSDFWFDKQDTQLLGSYPTKGFVIANKQQTGFYRVNYDLNNWRRIINYLNTKTFTNIIPVNRAQLINDAFNLANAGELNYAVALDLSEYISREVDYIPIKAFLTEMIFLGNKLEQSRLEHLFKQYVLGKLKTVAQQLTFHEKEEDDHMTKLTRVAVMTQICYLRDQKCQLTALETLRALRYNNTVILPPNMEEYVLCSGLRSGNRHDWEDIYRRYVEEDVEFKKKRILSALGCIENEDILNEYIHKIVNNSSLIPNFDRQIAFESIYLAGVFGRNTILSYMTEHFHLLSKSSLNVHKIISDIAIRLYTTSDRVMIKKLVRKYGYQKFGYAIAIVDENLEWSKRYVPIIEKWFKQHQ